MERQGPAQVPVSQHRLQALHGVLSECNSLADLLPRKWLQARVRLPMLFELEGYTPTA